MQANNDPSVSIEYTKSPLGIFLHQALLKINALKEKYPLEDADSSEKKQAN